MRTAFFLLMGIQLVLSVYGLLEILRWRGWVRRRTAAHSGFYTPRVALICPCKGLEPELEENLRALTGLDYPYYEVFFVLASAADPAHEVLRRITVASPHPAHIVVAGAPRDSSEKVNNLRAAAEQVGAECEVLVFTDSDGRPDRRWLGRLVAPLADAKLGAATTFRWLVPGDSRFASALAAAWNAAAVSLLGDHPRNFCWGGGTAIRRQTFDRIQVLEHWRGAAAEDYALTRALRSAGLGIRFVPECLVPSRVQAGWCELAEFTNRQMILTRVYHPRLWAQALAAHTFYSAALLYALFFVAWNWVQGAPAMPFALLLLLILLLAALRGLVRLEAVSELLAPEWKPELIQRGWAWVLLAPLAPFLYAWNSLVAATRRRITWRGNRYELASPTQTRILRR